MASSPTKLKAYLQLYRLPNLFTAMADIAMGFWLTHTAFDPGSSHVLMLMLVSSCLLYTAGMVLNDYFDRDVDARDRPHRPIPSGRVPAALAKIIGVEFLVLGVAFGWLVSFLTADLRAGLVASLLAAAVFLYDYVLKRTPLGPLAMGSCRMLNVLLGMSAAAAPWQSIHYVTAGGIGLYIVGVTWFARTEAHVSNRGHLTLATTVMMAGIMLCASLPNWQAAIPLLDEEKLTAGLDQWQLLMLCIALLLGYRCGRAILDPIPSRVQAAVKICILSLIVLDAAICFKVRSDEPIYALVIIALLLPTMWLGRWIYST
jgi:4-hydroxybenzoate polyprenyltransferase